MLRVIEVSHWGNIAIEETLDIHHDGAKLKGSFSRYEFQKDRRPRMPAVVGFKVRYDSRRLARPQVPVLPL